MHFVFPQDRPDGKAGLAREGGLTIMQLAMIVFVAANIIKGHGVFDSISNADATWKELNKLS